MTRHERALITIYCFLVGAPMPPKLARRMVFNIALLGFEANRKLK